MRVVVGWGGSGPAGAGDVLLTFSPAAAAAGQSAGADVVRADDLLRWDDRTRLEDEAATLLARCEEATGDVRVHGRPLFAVARWALLAELTNLLRAHAAGDALGLARPDARGAPLEADGCPSVLHHGAAAGLGSAVSGAGPWRSFAPPLLPSGGRERAADLIAVAQSKVRRARAGRIAVVAGMKAAAAVASSDPNRLRAAGAVLCLFPGLDHAAGARLAARLRLPVRPAARPLRGGETPEVELGELHADPALDRALRTAVIRTLGDATTATLHAAATLDDWERRLPALRAVVLPTAATGPSQLVVAWARERGIRTAVVQHGIYGMRREWGVEAGVDGVLAWGPAVEEQVAAWPGPAPAVTPVGVGGLSAQTLAPARGPRRVLVATTNPPLGSALGLYDFQRAFLEALAPGLRRLGRAGVQARLRPHPAEPSALYEAVLLDLGLDVPLAAREPLDAALDATDLLVSSVSSVAFEAAALGRPVLLWNGGLPAAVRHRYLLPPLDGALPGAFDDAAGFDALAALDGVELLERGEALRDELSRYVTPFAPERFVSGLEALAAD